MLDNCPDVFGNSTSSAVGENVVPYYGCIDTDGDGREDSTDAFPQTQHRLLIQMAMVGEITS